MSKSYDSYHDNWIDEINGVIRLLSNPLMDDEVRQVAVTRLRIIRDEIKADRDDCQ